MKPPRKERQRYRKIDPRIWTDAKFRSLSREAQLVFFLLLTNPDMTSLGAMRGTVDGLAAENRWERQAFRHAFEEVMLQSMAQADENEGLIYLPNFLKYNAPESLNCIIAWKKAYEMLPECEARSFVLSRARAYVSGLPKAWQSAFAQAFPHVMWDAMPQAFPHVIPYPGSREPGTGNREPGTESREQGTKAAGSPGTNAPPPPSLPFEGSDLPEEPAADVLPGLLADPLRRHCRTQDLAHCTDLLAQIRRSVAPACWRDVVEEIENALAKKDGRPGEVKPFVQGVVKKWLADRAQRKAVSEPSHEALNSEPPAGTARFASRTIAQAEREARQERARAKALDDEIERLPEAEREALYDEAWQALPQAERPLARTDRGAAVRRQARVLFAQREEVNRG